MERRIIITGSCGVASIVTQKENLMERKSKTDRELALRAQEKAMASVERLIAAARLDYATPPKDAANPSDGSHNGHKREPLLPFDFWDVRAQWNREGSLMPGDMGNAILSLIETNMVSDWRLNEWTRRIENNNPVADPFTGAQTPMGQVINVDEAVSDARLAIGNYVRYSPTKAAVTDAVEMCARQYAYNPVRAYFDNLPAWDNWERLYQLPQFYGADDTELNREILALIPRAIYARLTSDAPVKFDYCPVLYSKRQGIGKTRSLAVFALKPEYHLEGVDLSTSDVNRKLHERTAGKAVVELGEFSSLSRREMATLKEILTAEYFTNRLAYGHSSSTDAIRNIFVATTNEIRMLSDFDNRRFPVVECRDVDLDWLVDNMDQIYAEVKAKHKPGTAEIALPRHLWQAAQNASEVHRDISDFESWASEYLSNKVQVYSETLNADWHSRIGSRQVHSRELSAAMSKLGWVNSVKRVDGGTRRVWVRRDD